MRGFLLLLICLLSNLPLYNALRNFPKKSLAATKLRPLNLSPLVQDVAASALAVGGSAAWLQIWIQLAKSGKVDPKLSRKIIHSGSAPLFMCMWPLYSSGEPATRLIAAAVPLLQTVRLILAGTKTVTTVKRQEGDVTQVSSGSLSGVGLTNKDDLESNIDPIRNAISRTGDQKEALGGPLIYTIVLFLCTLLFFRESPVGIVSICQMALGDGLADIVGRRWGSKKWFFSTSKSYAGSAAFCLSAFLGSAFFLWYFTVTGSQSIDVAAKLPVLFLISAICTAVELLPIGDDNVNVPLAAAVLTYLLL